ncbi:MAG: hypothetical protein HQL15_02870 [Candidatus Omnitrophica bacterium]|nr:hypothetical protein [Candidatus Omnitrophota bacterium]
MNKILMTGLCIFVSKFLQGTVACAEDVTRVRLATMYLHAVKVSRLLFISLLGSGACLVLLLTGVVLIHCTIFIYAPWEVSVKVTVTLICAVFYLLSAAAIVAYFFTKDRWMAMFNTDSTIKELTGQS